jgi:hypothetical protein
MNIAQKGIELAQHVDSLITIPNEKLLTVLGREHSACWTPSARPTTCCWARCRVSPT